MLFKKEHGSDIESFNTTMERHDQVLRFIERLSARAMFGVMLIAGAVGLTLFLSFEHGLGQTGTQLNVVKASTVIPNPLPNCPLSTTTPVGQANPSSEPEPEGGVWCFPLSASPTTRTIDQRGGWVDDFQTNQQMGTFGAVQPPALATPTGNGYYGYIESQGGGYNLWNDLVTANENSGLKTQYFINNNHWMVDFAPAKTEGGALISPSKQFSFENGKLVVEADVAAALDDYKGGGADVFPEIGATNAPSVTIGKSESTLGVSCGSYASSGAGVYDFNAGQWHTGICKPADTLYTYGAFPGFWAFGCRLQNTRVVVCSLYDPTGTPGVGNDQAVPHGLDGGRVYELSNFELATNAMTNCNDIKSCGNGSYVFGGQPSDTETTCNAQGNCTTLDKVWRTCQHNQMDMFCRDRFRLELTRDTINLLVNGFPYFVEHVAPGDQVPSNGMVPAGQIFPNGFLGNPVTTYFSSWTSAFNPDGLVRFHWGRVAVNPHNPDGTIVAPSTAPTFCLDMPQSTCQMGGITPPPAPMPSPSPTPSPAPAPSPSPSPAPAPKPSPSPSPAPSPSPTPSPAPAPSPNPKPGTLILGNASIGPETDQFDANIMNATLFTMGAVGGTVQSMSVHVGAVDASPYNQFQLAIYTDNSDSPGTLIARSNSATLHSNSWNTATISEALKANTHYWLVYNTNASRYDRNNMNFINSTSAESAWQTNSQTFNSWPGTFGDITRQDAMFSIYATLATQ